ncbi:MAG: CHASE2 domain-containing protein [Desulfobacteraceae bacterium]|nr:MAG: CHASE2 domain-containing protein [Desulfobacteraceae bacterium]
MKKYPEILLGVCATALFLFLSLYPNTLTDRIEFGFYDIVINLSAKKPPHEKIVIVEIDEGSMATIDGLPWSGPALAKGLDMIHDAGPKVIGLGIMPDVLRHENGTRALSEIVKKGGNVILPIRLRDQAVISPKGLALPEVHRVSSVNLESGSPAKGIVLPSRVLLNAALGTGHTGVAYDFDARVRMERLIYPFHNTHVPSYALRLAAAFEGISPGQITARQSSGIRVGSLRVAADRVGRIGIRFRKSPHGFSRCAWTDVIAKKIPASLFKNRIVLVTPVVPGTTDYISTPVHPIMSPGELTAHAVASIIDGTQIQHPAWAPWIRAGLILVTGVLLVLLLPRLRPGLAFTFTGCFLFCFLGSSAVCILVSGLHMPLMLPSLQLTAGFIGLTWIRYLQGASDRSALQNHIHSSEKMILKPERTADEADQEDTFAKTVDTGADTAYFPEDAPTVLGRYEILKELGRGAMGVVYQGKDPRINRITAIKTVRFDQEYDPGEAKTAKAAFFREAESAGTLSHPNIVTIYDAGEDQGLAYIAMEYLEGEELTKYTRKDALLPMRKVIDAAADIADALDFAHEKGIVHRDIKPANIMLLRNGTVKITDFGIARITATSQTRTGIIKGTPLCMSPEQITGQKVDGRSDIFSLGVMLFQCLTGERPFSDDNPVALMHKILNDPHPDPRKINPRIYKPLSAIINKALEKEPADRYPKAKDMAAHLRKLGRLIDDAVAKKKARNRSG